MLSTPVAERLRAWAARHEVSVTAAIELAVTLYLEAGRAPGVRRPGPRSQVRFRLPRPLHQRLRRACRTTPAGWSQMVEGAVVGLVAAEGLPVGYSATSAG